MNIGIFDPYLDDCGGGEKYMLSIAEVLSQKHTVSIFWENEKDLENVKSRFALRLPGVKLTSNIFSSKYSFLKRYNESKKFDAIIILSDGSIPYLACRTYLHFQRPMEHIKLSMAAKWKLKRIKNVFCNSVFTKSYIDKTFHINSDVLYPPVTFHPQKYPKQKTILHVGRFRIVDRTVGAQDFKKQYILIDTFKELIDKGLTHWKFILAVSVKKEDQDEFNKLALSVKKYPIEFKINLKNKDLWELYSKASIYWHASGFGEDLEKYPERAEHFGISTVEAMGAGAVPVVINAGGQKEIVTDGENGLLWNSLPELKEETLILMNSHELLSELSKNAKLRAQDFDFKTFEQGVQKIISL